MSHYFDKIPDTKSEKKLIDVKISGLPFKFYTDNSVFSKKGLDFGTRTLLESLDVNNLKGDILDLGCGYGPIGIYISKTTGIKVDMVDINFRSLELSLENSKLNNVTTNVFYSDGYENINNKYDYIITNPPIRIGKKKLYDLLFSAKNHMNKNAEMWLVINKDQGAKSLVKDLENEYQVEIVTKNKGFYVIKAIYN